MCMANSDDCNTLNARNNIIKARFFYIDPTMTNFNKPNTELL